MTQQSLSTINEGASIWSKLALGVLLVLIVAMITAFFMMIGYNLSNTGKTHTVQVTEAASSNAADNSGSHDMRQLLERIDAERSSYQETLSLYRDQVDALNSQLESFKNEGREFDPSIRSVRSAVDKALSALVTEYKLGEIEKIGDGGLYQVAVNGNPLYFTGDGKIMVEGDAFGTEDGFEYTQHFIENNAEKISESAANKNPEALPKEMQVPENEEVPLELIEAPDQKAEAAEQPSQALQKFPSDLTVLTGDVGAPVQVAVFTDPDCPFCRRFEAEAERFEGVEIANMLFPVEQIHPGATEISKKIWCAEDSEQAFKDYMKNGDKSALEAVDASCENPLEKIATAAARVGVRGTPTFLSADGRVLEGYEGKEAFMKWVHNK